MREMLVRRGGARPRRPSWALWLVALLAPAAACGSGSAEPVGVAAYSAVIDDFLPDVPADGSRPVVFVARLTEHQFALEDQVAMIESVGEPYDLRFVDDVDAAIDDGDPETPTREEGLLLGIGTISASAPHVVRVEVYSTAGPIDAHKLTLSVRDDVWRVDASESVEPEVLVGDE